MSKVTENYEALAAAVGLRYDGANNVLYGQREEFELVVYAADSRYPYMLTIQTAAKSPNGSALTKEEKKEFAKGIKHVMALKQEGSQIKVSQKAVNKQEKLKEALAESVSSLLSFLRTRGYAPCCSFCGQKAEAPGFKVGSAYMHLCPDCEGKIRTNMLSSAQEMQGKKENVIGGIVGALLGSLVGVLCIILLSQLGYVAALSGVIMAVGVLKGYELLGGRISKKSIAICVIIMLIMTYVGDRLDWAIMLWRGSEGAYGLNVFEWYRLVPELISSEVIELGTYGLNLFLIYLFLLLGAIPTLRSKVKERQEKGRIVRIGSASDFIGNVNSFNSYSN